MLVAFSLDNLNYTACVQRSKEVGLSKPGNKYSLNFHLNVPVFGFLLQYEWVQVTLPLKPNP